MTGLPTGTVTFLFTDIEGSTRLWEQYPEAMKAALARHDEIVRGAVEANGGHVVKTTGDGVHAVFMTVHEAVRAAIDTQVTLCDEPWPDTGPLRVRMGVHTGEAEHREGDYYGTAVNRAARLMAAAHGGQILVSHASEELLDDGLADDVHLSDLGEHRLRDLSRAERIFQVSAPGLDAPFIAPRSLDAYPGNLPVQLTSFVGRDVELNKLSEALEDARLVTLTGVGGVGKTRLATQLAAEVVPRFPDGAWLCELAAADDAVALAEVVAATLNVRPRPGLELDDSIIEFARAKELLLVLDNCEHLLDAAGRLADAILRSCPRVRIVATSREGLAIAGEHVVPLRSLTVPSGEDTTEDVLESEAMQLFVDRAGAARATFVADERNAAAIADICRRLDGIPLAIELAAARVTAMSPGDIATRLDERFRLLTGGRRAAVERHQTLRATVDWSYSLLEDVERTVFDRLGVFVGGFDSRAAEAVVSGAEIEAWDVVDAISGLVSKSMVIADEASDGGIRYQLLETLRHYARERLDERGAADDWRRRHAEYFALIAEEVGPRITGPDELSAKRRLMGDLDNFRAAVTWGLDRTEQSDSELAVRIIAALARFGTNVRWTGISAWAHEALDHVERTTPGRRTDLLGLAAMNAFYGGNMRESEQFAAAAIRDGLGADCSAATLPYIALANIAANRGDVGTAHRLVEDSLRAFDDSGLHDDWHHVLMVTCDAMWSVMAGEPLSVRVT